MEIVIAFVVSIACYVLGVVTSPEVKSLFRRTKKTYSPPVHIPDKPQNQYTDYTVDELEMRKRKLEREYGELVDWPILRRRNAREIKEILVLLEWHYDQDGTRDFLAQKEKTRRELAEFDEQYRAALRGGN